MNKKKIKIWHVDLDGHYSGVGYVNTINEAKKINKYEQKM